MGTRKEFLQHLWTGVINANLRQDGLDNLVMLFEELLMADPSGMEFPGLARRRNLASSQHALWGGNVSSSSWPAAA